MATALETPPWLVDTPSTTTPAPAPAAPTQNSLAPPPWLVEGYQVPEAPGGGTTAAPAPEAPAEPASFLRNVATGMMRAPGTVAAVPNTLASLWQMVAGKQPGIASAILNSGIFPTEAEYTSRTTIPAYNWLTGSNFQPYKPQTGLGDFTQNVIASAPLAAYGRMTPTGLLPKAAAENARYVPLAAREAENVLGNAGVEIGKQAFPNDPAAQVVGGLLAGGALTPLVGKGASYGANLAGQVRGSEKKVQQTAQNRVEFGEPVTYPGQEIVNKLADTGLGAGIGYATGLAGQSLGLGHLPMGELIPLAGGLFGGYTGYRNHSPYTVASRVESFQNRVNNAVDDLVAQRNAAAAIPDPATQWINRTPGVSAGQQTMSGNILYPTTAPPPWTMPQYHPQSRMQYFLDRTAGLLAPQMQVKSE